jgi:hypothetical protein
MEYNPYDFDSCMRYIDENDITFDNARDILQKHDCDFYDPCEEVREIALQQAKQLINFYHDKYYNEIKDYCRVVDTTDLDKLLGNYFDYKLRYEVIIDERMKEKHGRN